MHNSAACFWGWSLWPVTLCFSLQQHEVCVELCGPVSLGLCGRPCVVFGLQRSQCVQFMGKVGFTLRGLRNAKCNQTMIPYWPRSSRVNHSSHITRSSKYIHWSFHELLNPSVLYTQHISAEELRSVKLASSFWNTFGTINHKVDVTAGAVPTEQN